MNIALFGYGKMGKEIEAFAKSKKHHITARVDSSHPKESFDLTDTDIIIEFSKPEFAAENIKFAIDNSIPIVVGTTGWYSYLDELTTYCNTKNGTILHATNFSIGVNAFFAVNKYLAKLMNHLPDYQAEIVEIHHTEKLDAPSGTGISLAEQIMEEHTFYSKWERTRGEKVTNDLTIPIESIRLPNVAGTHEVKYTSEIDTIEIKHTAHNRKGFAQGSVIAAEWLQGKTGIYTMQDILNF